MQFGENMANPGYDILAAKTLNSRYRFGTRAEFLQSAVILGGEANRQPHDPAAWRNRWHVICTRAF